jgi:hypothetical protein
MARFTWLRIMTVVGAVMNLLVQCNAGN